jgi:hypothetical protein
LPDDDPDDDPEEDVVLPLLLLLVEPEDVELLDPEDDELEDGLGSPGPPAHAAVADATLATVANKIAARVSGRPRSRATFSGACVFAEQNGQVSSDARTWREQATQG